LSSYGKEGSLDTSEEALSLCRTNGLEHIKNASIETMPYSDEYFDFIFLVDILEHIKNEEKAMKELHRVLKTDGLLVVTVPAFMCLWGYHDELVGHLRRYNKTSLKQLSMKTNFTFKALHYYNFLLFLPLWIIRKTKKYLKIKKDDFHKPYHWLNNLFIVVLYFDTVIAKHLNVSLGTSLIVVLAKNKGK